MTENTEVRASKKLQEMTPYSPGKPIWEVKRDLGLQEVIKLASNENPLGPSPKALIAIANSLPELHRYPDTDSSELKQAIAKTCGLQTDQFIVTNGGDELITLVSEAFLDPEDEVVVPEPSFSEYKFGALLMGAKVIKVPLKNNYLYDIQAILSSVTNRTKIVYLCSPNNPTGTFISRSELQQILDALPQHVLVVLDAAYSHYASATEYSDGLEFVRAGYPILVLQTFSKIYGLAGIRVGFGAAPNAIIQSIAKVKEPFNVNALAQAAAIAAIADFEHVNRSRTLVIQERRRLYESFHQLGLGYTESMSNFILVELGPKAKLLYEQLMNKGIIVRYGVIWGLPHHVRISVGTTEDNDKLIQSLREVLDNDAKPSASAP